MRYVLALSFIAFLGGAAYAAPSDDQTKLQDSLKAQGYSKWKRIELDKGVYEVDDAIDAAGKQFDLRIDASNMKVIEKEAED